MALGARRISVSTVGIVPGILKLAREPWQVNLSVSLHAADDGLRGRLMPANRQYPLKELLGAVKKYIDTTNRRVMVEYLLLGGVNDGPGHARALAKLLKEGLQRLYFVNLIQYNQTGQYRQSERAAAERFRQALERENVETIERYRFGRDIKGACGQLAGEII
jgi:adenine C2-methylase RlmN of 23S rRNA A2503 and tRNA A37